MDKSLDTINKKNFADGLYSRFYDKNLGPEIILNDRKIIMFGAVNYLCLSHHPLVIKESIKATEQFGAGGLGSRFSNGTLKIHNELDESLAKFINKECAITYNSGYMANLGVLSSVCENNSLIFSDKENHLSIYDACKLSGLKYFRYKHNDLNHLESLLKKFKDVPEKWVALVGTFGVTGEIPKLPGIVELCRKYQAKIYLDDAHNIGILGENKRGLADKFKILENIDLIMGSFQMAFGNIGAFVAGPSHLIDKIRVHSRPYIFSYGLPAHNVMAIIKSLAILQSEEGNILVKKLLCNVDNLKEKLKSIKFKIVSDDSHITSLIIGNEVLTAEFSQKLLEKGIWVQTYIHPSVPRDKGIIRLTCMSVHSSHHIDSAVKAIEETWEELGLPSRVSSQ